LCQGFSKAAASAGVRPGEVEALAVNASPCGGCRQWLLEFGVDRVIFLHEGEILVRRPDQLLPDSFEL
jgi:cytidine deaminase